MAYLNRTTTAHPGDYWQSGGQYAQIYGELKGHYVLPGPSYDVTRNYVSHVQIVLQSGGQSHARIDASVPLTNAPEVLSAYWRTDFDRDPTTTNGNGDAVADWAMASDTFDSDTLTSGVWETSGAIETRPLHDFTKTTTVEVNCRNTSVGGNGAVIRINADRQSGLYARYWSMFSDSLMERKRLRSVARRRMEPPSSYSAARGCRASSCAYG